MYTPYTGPIITKASAIEQGLKRYFTGVPCIHGHISQRLTARGSGCVTCLNIRQLKYHTITNRKKGVKERVPNVARLEAIKEGKTRFWSDKPCPVGHVGWRSVKKGLCIECKNIKRRSKAPPRQILTPEEKKERRRLQYKTKSANRRKQGGGKLKWAEVKKLLEVQKYKCMNCGACIKKKSHADHIVPVAMGGKSVISNMQMLCPPCNIRKSDKHPVDWAMENGRLV